MSGPKEIEAKYALDDADALRGRLVALAGERAGIVEQVDVFFDDGSGRYCGGGCGLRIRTTRGIDPPSPAVCCVTFKGPLEEAGGLKVRTELETALGSGDTAASILAALGFSPVVTVRKTRESWRLGGCAVEMDAVELAGQFVEVEGPSADAVRAVCAQLGLDGEPTTTSYACMVAGK